MRTKLIAVLSALALVLMACGEDDAPEITDDPPPDDPPAAEEADVAVASTDLGEVLVDGEGMTLYLFEADEQGESTCEGDCAENWPPLTIDGEPVAGEGADDALLGTTERADGTTQVTYDDWPLYHWAGDEAPGETNGQGVGDVWWVIAADGTPVRDAAEEDDETTLGY